MDICGWAVATLHSVNSPIDIKVPPCPFEKRSPRKPVSRKTTEIEDICKLAQVIFLLGERL